MKLQLNRLANAIRHLPTEYQVRKAKNAHRKKNPRCALCGTTGGFFGRKNDVHHRTPVHIDSSRAADPTNLITLCRLHHWLIGHCKDWRSWNIHVDDTIAAMVHQFTLTVFKMNDKEWENMKDVVEVD